jgi:hypothetical protein
MVNLQRPFRVSSTDIALNNAYIVHIKLITRLVCREALNYFRRPNVVMIQPFVSLKRPISGILRVGAFDTRNTSCSPLSVR